MSQETLITYDADVHDFLKNYFQKDSVTVTFEYDPRDFHGGFMSKCRKVTFEHRVKYFNQNDIEVFSKYFIILEIEYAEHGRHRINKFSIDPGDSYKLMKDYFCDE